MSTMAEGNGPGIEIKPIIGAVGILKPDDGVVSESNLDVIQEPAQKPAGELTYTEPLDIADSKELQKQFAAAKLVAQEDKRILTANDEVLPAPLIVLEKKTAEVKDGKCSKCGQMIIGEVGTCPNCQAEFRKADSVVSMTAVA